MSGKRYVFVEDLHAGEIGMDSDMGLLYPKGAIVDNLLPGMDEALLQRKKILPESEWLARQSEKDKKKAVDEQGQQAAAETEGKAKSAPANKRGRSARQNKSQ